MNLHARNAVSLVNRDESDRFRPPSDWFVTSRSDGVYVARIGVTSERAVDLLHALSVHLDPEVDVFLSDERSGTEWGGTDVPVSEFRDALGRMRFPLATYGGVEVTAVGPNDQLSLTSELQVVIYARSDRWYFLLDGLGLSERTELPAPSWTPSRSSLVSAPELTAALTAAAARLGLAARAVPVSP